MLGEGLKLVEDNLNKKGAAYQVFKTMRKTAELAEIDINLIAEIQAIWKAANQNPLNGVTAGAAGTTQGIIQIGLAVARATGASIKIAAFAEGGNTVRSQNLMESRQVLAMLSGATGGSQAPGGTFAGGGPVNKATIGLIGEAGPELVIPNRLHADPKQADLMGMLEAQIASRGNTFAAGGSTINGFSTTGNNVNDSSMTEVLQQMVRVLAQLDGRLGGVEGWQQNLEVSLDLVKTKRSLEVIEKTQNGGGIR
jgi:hypothetical protein